MGRLERPIKFRRLAALKCFVIFNLAAVVGFILGTVSFTASMFVFPNPTFAWLFGNCIGGLSHFGANYKMQRQKKEKIVKNFIVFNATGMIGFLVATGMFAAAIIFLQNSTAAWLMGSFVGTLTHFLLNDRAMKLEIKRQCPY